MCWRLEVGGWVDGKIEGDTCIHFIIFLELEAVKGGGA